MNLQTIQKLRERKYSAPPLKIEKVIFEKEEYTAYLASYISDGLKIYGFLTVPKDSGQAAIPEGARMTKGSYPVIIFNKGYLPLDSYATDRQYIRYIDYLAKEGFIVFKSDYRGYGDSEGKEETIFEAGYAIDVLNAIEALKEFRVQSVEFRINDIYLWGHSLGEDITLKVLEVRNDVKAASIWSAPTASYDKLVKRWQSRDDRRELVNQLISKLGNPDENAEVYKKYSPSAHLEYINTPIQLIHGKEDDRVPVSDSEDLKDELEKSNKKVVLGIIKGNHNLTDNLDEAMKETIRFFKNA